MKTAELIAELQSITQTILEEAQEMKSLSAKIANQQPGTGRWSALECLEHLNRYGDFYIPEIKSRLAENHENPRERFKAGLFGNYFVHAVKPGAKKMDTFKNMNPSLSTVRADTLNVFIAQQKEISALIERASQYDLSRIKTRISISKLLKLRLGDTLRVVVYHNQRHMLQAKRAIDLALKLKKAAV